MSAETRAVSKAAYFGAASRKSRLAIDTLGDNETQLYRTMKFSVQPLVTGGVVVPARFERVPAVEGSLCAASSQPRSERCAEPHAP